MLQEHLIMKSLPHKLNKYGYLYVQIARGNRSCVYEQHVIDNIRYYEVFIIKISPERIFKGHIFEAHEKFPDNESFGATAWTFKSKEEAMKKYQELESSDSITLVNERSVMGDQENSNEKDPPKVKVTHLTKILIGEEGKELVMYEVVLADAGCYYVVKQNDVPEGKIYDLFHDPLNNKVPPLLELTDVGTKVNGLMLFPDYYGAYAYFCQKTMYCKKS